MKGLNCDGAYSNATKDAGYGVVVRGNCGEVIGECGGHIQASWGLLAEALAISL